METKEQARLIAKVLNDKKGIDVKVIKIFVSPSSK